MGELVHIRAVDFFKNVHSVVLELVRALLMAARVATDSASLLRLRLLVLANVTLQFLDGWVTLIGTSRGFAEGNPLVAAAMASYGPMGGLVLMKLMAVAFLCWIYRLGAHPIVERGLVSVAVTYLLFAVLPWTVLLAGTPSG